MAMSKGYETSFRTMLGAVGRGRRIRHPEIDAFWPMKGHRYQGELLVLGRAVNGWDTTFCQADLARLSSRERIVRRARDASEANRADACPMLWVTSLRGQRGRYNTNTSAFWRVIRRVQAGLGVDPDCTDHWPSHMAWSNLYKLSRGGSGNPGAILCRAQMNNGLPGVIRRELDELSPKRVLVLSGRDWFEPFASALNLKVRWRGGYVVGAASEPGRRWVIAEHPQTRPEDPFVQQVLNAF
ncbi:MAG: hypothetical protein JKY65_01760 [Planctomycetes bacterium]|nr:hypothetical protein [Planctomycetota bacterium]